MLMIMLNGIQEVMIPFSNFFQTSKLKSPCRSIIPLKLPPVLLNHIKLIGKAMWSVSISPGLDWLLTFMRTPGI